jgi:hypothetical protein
MFLIGYNRTGFLEQRYSHILRQIPAKAASKDLKAYGTF